MLECAYTYRQTRKENADLNWRNFVTAVDLQNANLVLVAKWNMSVEVGIC